MPRINPIDANIATGSAKQLLDGVKAQLGGVPNLIATFAQSPKVLEGYLALNAALGQGALSARLREQIALTVAGVNNCDYCASAHTVLGRRAGIDAEELSRNLRGQSQDRATQAALNFVRAVVKRRGQMDDDDVEALRSVGFGDGEIVEIVAHIGLNLFTNYFNHIAATEIDFPAVDTTAAFLAA